MTSLNKVTLIGRATKDPDVRATNDGRKVANLSLATNETWKDKDGNKKEKVEYHKISCFNEGLVNVIEKYIKKGALLYIEGSLQTKKYEKDGIERYSTEIVLQGYGCQLTMLDKPDREPTKHDKEKQNAYQPDADENSVPF
jgi:single-strand DNA-binding protein